MSSEEDKPPAPPVRLTSTNRGKFGVHRVYCCVVCDHIIRLCRFASRYVNFTMQIWPFHAKTKLVQWIVCISFEKYGTRMRQKGGKEAERFQWENNLFRKNVNHIMHCAVALQWIESFFGFILCVGYFAQAKRQITPTNLPFMSPLNFVCISWYHFCLEFPRFQQNRSPSRWQCTSCWTETIAQR